ncbi:hypothetical protein Tsubulata_013063 [Turnera subulata]|uniref:Uncharacterized protein n=1 Tax=Turnera subulata TaxID=218843 RepID=A0A9Q0J171_9ROSI|nr:hypothetical protein Tsubulata_013063 [Turnera subulata]
MGFLAHREVILLLCIFHFAVQTEKVSGLTSIDLALRWNQRLLPFSHISRILKTVALDDLQPKAGLAPAPSMMFDPNQSDKRRVRRGSDPIHNRC